MKPIVCELEGEEVLVLAFVAADPDATSYAAAVIVRANGRMSSCQVHDLIVKRPTLDFPMGYAFAAEPVVP